VLTIEGGRYRLRTRKMASESRFRALTCTASSRSPHSRGTKPQSEYLPLSDSQRQTIYALATPPGKAGIGVIRISGPASLVVWRELIPARKRTVPEPCKMTRCRFVDPLNGETLDDGLAVFFKGVSPHPPCVRRKTETRTQGPKSFTAEDVLELHIHSGRAIVASILSSLSRVPFCRPAEPGEFTRRAFEAGRLDLTQVEGLKDLIGAETETQRRLARRAVDVRLPGVWSLSSSCQVRALLGHNLSIFESK
jgi:tRNA modification GTPase